MNHCKYCGISMIGGIVDTSEGRLQHLCRKCYFEHEGIPDPNLKKPEPQKIRIALGPVDTEMATRPPCNRCKHGEDKTERQECWECPRPVTQYQNYEPK